MPAQVTNCQCRLPGRCAYSECDWPVGVRKYCSASYDAAEIRAFLCTEKRNGQQENRHGAGRAVRPSRGAWTASGTSVRTGARRAAVARHHGCPSCSAENSSVRKAWRQPPVPIWKSCGGAGPVHRHAAADFIVVPTSSWHEDAVAASRPL